MTELERALTRLGSDLELPQTPDLASAVRRRLAPRRRRWWAVAVAVALAAAVAVAFAVPSSRGAILRFFHIRGAEVRVVDRLPALPVNGALGEPVALRDASFRLLLPDGRRPEGVFAYQGGYWLRYPDLLVFELATGNATFLKKVAGGLGRVEYVDVAGEPGIWIGSRHVVYLPGGAGRTSGRVLLWQHGELTLRLEADVARDRAIALASTFR